MEMNGGLSKKDLDLTDLTHKIQRLDTAKDGDITRKSEVRCNTILWNPLTAFKSCTRWCPATSKLVIYNLS
jgi:hypothetical protein